MIEFFWFKIISLIPCFLLVYFGYGIVKDSRLLKAEEFVKSHEGYIAPDDKAFVLKSSESDKKRKRRDKLFIGSAFLLLLSVIVVITYLLNLSNSKTQEAEKAQKETQQLLYKNTIQQGKLYRDHLNDPLKSKLIFADAIVKSTNEEECKNGELLYNSIFKMDIYLDSIKEHNHSVYGATFSKDASEILSWSAAGTLRLWSTQSEQLLKTFKHNHSVYGASFSNDESKILSWSVDGELRLWSSQSEEPLKTFKHKTSVLGASFSKDDSQILSWSADRTVSLHPIPILINY